MMNIEEIWHALVQRIENLRHHVDPALHQDLDEIGLHAAQLKAAAGGEVTKIAAIAPDVVKKFVGAEVKTVDEDVLKAAQSASTETPATAKDVLK